MFKTHTVLALHKAVYFYGMACLAGGVFRVIIPARGGLVIPLLDMTGAAVYAGTCMRRFQPLHLQFAICAQPVNCIDIVFIQPFNRIKVTWIFQNFFEYCGEFPWRKRPLLE